MKAYFQLMRLKQWVKNVFVLAPLLFSFHFMEFSCIFRAGLAFLAFSFVASTHYIINDILDKEKDALHPQKKNRPIAGGSISVFKAFILVLGFISVALFCLDALGEPKVAGVICLYFVMNILYSWKLKNIVLLDVFVIACGFVLRVYAGAYAIHVGISGFIFMTTLFLSLFLGFTKRKGELVRYGSISRKVLQDYGPEMLNAFIAISIALTIMSYAMWTMETSTRANLGTHRMIYSIVFVIYGMFRYLYILDKYANSEDPTENLYQDKTLLAICFLYVFYVLLLFLNVL